MTLANAHALFYGLKRNPSYLANLAVPKDELQALMDARQQIRAALKAAATQLPFKDSYWQDSYSTRVSARNRPPVVIKFMTQGSYAYKTLNAPAQALHQEIDLDDGMYVPVEFLQNGEPALAAKGLFAFVETVLQPICEKNGWSLAPKPCCVRVKLWRGAHIDIPIYSMPQDRFLQLQESMAKSATAMLSLDSVSGHFKLPSDQIVLAKRDGSWTKSDPQQLHEWVLGRVDRYGPIFRRLSRFYKGWRDHTWTNSELSSLCLMRAIDIAMTDISDFPTDDRDDEWILIVSEKLPTILSSPVPNPVLPDLYLNEWKPDDREIILRGAQALYDEMSSALERTGDAERVVARIRETFGDRIPYRPDVVKIGSKIAAIQKAPAAIVAAPNVVASTSG